MHCKYLKFKICEASLNFIMRSFFYICLAILTAKALVTPDYKLYPDNITLPITFYDYKVWRDLGDEIKGCKDVTVEEQVLCDFNICKTGRSYCANHQHKDNDSGKVAKVLNSDGFPYIPADVVSVSYKHPEKWFTKNKWNVKIESNITLNKVQQTDSVPVYKFDQASNWQPINCMGWDAADELNICKNGKQRNSVFATHFQANIIYTKDLSSITIASDDDSWLFIDKQLAIDYGGTRSPTRKTFNIASNLFQEGQEYQVDFFHADRCETNAAFTIIGPLTCNTVKGLEKNHDTDGDGVEDCLDGCPKNKYLVDKVNNTCDLDSCEHIPTEKLCGEINNDDIYNTAVEGKRKFNCSWCNKEKRCVNYGECPCDQVADDEEDICKSYEGGRCNFCRKGSSPIAKCNEPEDCTCADLLTIDQCYNAIEGCKWCGSQCVSTADDCPACETFTDKDECVSVDSSLKNDDGFKPKCVWCANGSDPSTGSCKTECKCDGTIKDEDTCQASVTESHRTNEKQNGNKRFQSEDNKKFCKLCRPYKNEDDKNFCYATTQNICTECYLNKDKESCETNVTCKWCGDMFGCRASCPTCDTFTDIKECFDARMYNKDKPDEASECTMCDSGTCIDDQVCASCESIHEELTPEKMKDYIYFDKKEKAYKFYKEKLEDLKEKVNEIKKECRNHYQPRVNKKSETKCSVCINDFFVKIYKNGTFEVPPICAPSDGSTCWNCDALNVKNTNTNASQNDEPSGKRNEGENTEQNDNGFIVLTISDDDVDSACSSIINTAGQEICGYCPFKKECQPLSSDEITAYNMLARSSEREDFIFHHCDTNCTLYANDFRSCTKSALNCTWCIGADANMTDTFSCGPQDQECKACSGFTSSLQCTASGCKWCDKSNKCITRNRPCVESIAAIGIGAGVIAGIAVGAVAAVAISSFASKKVYDAIVEAKETSMDSATSNPLFEEKEDGGVNPTFEVTTAE